MYIEPRLPDHTDIWTANLNSRIVHCFGEIEENMAESIVAQLLYLDVLYSWCRSSEIRNCGFCFA